MEDDLSSTPWNGPRSEGSSGAGPTTNGEHGAASRTAPGPASHESRISDNHGQAVSVGVLHGDVNLHERPDYRELLGEVATRRLRHAAGLGADRVREVRLTFHPADPLGYRRFTKDLDEYGLGLITGEPGCGRIHTAIRALAGPFPEASSEVDPSFEAEETGVDEVVVEPDTPDAGLAGIIFDTAVPRLLDLTPLPYPEPSQRAAVRALLTKARTRGVQLVVVARPGAWENELVARRARLHLTAQPRPEDVLEAALRRLHGEDPLVELWIQDTRVRDLLSGGSPARAVRFVREVDHARPPHGPLGKEDHLDWLDRALRAFTESGEPLPGWPEAGQNGEDGHRTEFTRALIQTVALLEGARSAVIADRTHALAERWNIAPPYATPVSGEGFSRLLEDIGARLHTDRVHFDRRDHGRHALDHLWREHPGARASYQQWADDAAAHLPKSGRVLVATRWLDLARRHRDPSPMLALLHNWGLRNGLIWAAVPAVAQAAVSAELGPQVRFQLYRLATSEQPSSRHVMAMEVCRIYGRLQPGTALTRLRHLADRLPHTWTDNLDRALQEIAAERGNLPAVLAAVPDWLTGGEGARSAAIRFLSALLAGESAPNLPDALERGEVAPAVLAGVWQDLHHALPGPQGPELRLLLWSWLDVLAERPRYSQTLTCLYSAAEADPAFAETLSRCARRWAVSHTRPALAVEKLRRALARNDER